MDGLKKCNLALYGSSGTNKVQHFLYRRQQKTVFIIIFEVGEKTGPNQITPCATDTTLSKPQIGMHSTDQLVFSFHKCSGRLLMWKNGLDHIAFFNQLTFFKETSVTLHLVISHFVCTTPMMMNNLLTNWTIAPPVRLSSLKIEGSGNDVCCCFLAPITSSYIDFNSSFFIVIGISTNRNSKFKKQCFRWVAVEA